MVSHLLNIFIFFLTLSFPTSKSLGADKYSKFEIGGGAAIVEEGDDRIRPGALLHVGAADYYLGRVYTWGRKFGPVTERSILIAAQRRVEMFDVDGLSAALGLCLLSESTTIKHSGDTSQDDVENNTNLGGVLGLHYRLEKIAPIYFEFGWDSHLFLAGPNGGLFLANGRKQTISLGLGMRL